MKDIQSVNTFKEWLDNQGKINWRLGGMGFLFDYKGARCMAMLSKTATKGKLFKVDLTIRPIIASENIEGKLAGEAEYLSFCNK